MVDHFTSVESLLFKGWVENMNRLRIVIRNLGLSEFILKIMVHVQRNVTLMTLQTNVFQHVWSLFPWNHPKPI